MEELWVVSVCLNAENGANIAIGGNMVMSSQLMLSTQIQITLLYTPSNAAPQFL